MGHPPDQQHGQPPNQPENVSRHRRATLTPDYQRHWPAYFDAVTGKPPRDTLLLALQSPGLVPGLAVDIACGEGRDTRAILAHDPAWRVLAIDWADDGLARLQASLDPADAARVTLARARMEDIAGRFAGVGPASLVNASFALPFCDPGAFAGLWSWIGRTLGPGGVFAGQFFGDRDEWAAVRPGSHRTRAQVSALLEAFDVLHLDEVEKDGDDAMGGAKHHHVFHVVAAWRGATREV